MRIHQDFIGGNISVERIENGNVYLKNELRDTDGDWFYWAFCIEGAQGMTVRFNFEANRLGYFGPAVSYDLESWRWLGRSDGNTFTYTFSESENKVYFAHSMLYHPARFERFAKTKGLELETLCKSEKGREIPFVTFGSGRKTVILTSRHHACESTGSYVLEGVLDVLSNGRADDIKVFCIPFVDYDGVLDGDQGKNRRPHDQNRDYPSDGKSVYSATEAIRKIAGEYGAHLAFDFHSPWHKGGINDKVFIVQPSKDKQTECKKFGELLEGLITERSLKYQTTNDYPPDFGWNSSGSPTFSRYMLRQGARLAFSLETAYFGEENNAFTAEKAVELGRCFARAIKKYLKT